MTQSVSQSVSHFIIISQVHNGCFTHFLLRSFYAILFPNNFPMLRAPFDWQLPALSVVIHSQKRARCRNERHSTATMIKEERENWDAGALSPTIRNAWFNFLSIAPQIISEMVWSGLELLCNPPCYITNSFPTLERIGGYPFSNRTAKYPPSDLMNGILCCCLGTITHSQTLL